MIEYQGNKYNSKAEVVRDLYAQGKLTMAAHLKKKIADELGMTVQTVHATLKKLMDSGTTRLSAPAAPNVSTAHESKPRKHSVITIIASGVKKDIDDKPEKEINGKRIQVTCAPNVWGLPITNPPTFVIDDTYKGDVAVNVDEEQNELSDLFQQ